MVDVLVSTTVHCPRPEVAAYAADPENAPEWYVNIRSAAWRTPARLAVGSEVDFTARFLGRDLAYTYRIEEFVPGSRIVMSTAQGPFPMRTTYTWDDDGEGGTVMTLRNEGKPSGFATLTVPFMEAMMRRATRKDLARLKDLLERR